MIKLKRIYDNPEENDGFRVLVDRLWPRGMKKENAAIDLWIKEIAPSSELRKWFNHDPDKWEKFCRKYINEIRSKQNEIEMLTEKIESGNLTLLYAAKDVRHNNAVVLKKYLESIINQD